MKCRAIGFDLFAVLLFLCIAPQSFVIAQSDVITHSQYEPTDKASEVKAEGIVKPHFWKCVIDRNVTLIPLDQVVSISLHDYVVDGGRYVKEMTVILANESYLRFYYTDSIALTGMVGARLQTLMENAKTKTENYIGLPPLSPIETFSTDKKVVKNYPATTHIKMIEQRLKKIDSVEKLYENFEKVLIEHRAHTLLEKERNKILRTIEIEENVP